MFRFWYFAIYSVLILIFSIIACAQQYQSFQPLKKEIIFDEDYANNPKLASIKMMQNVTIKYAVGIRLKGNCFNRNHAREKNIENYDMEFMLGDRQVINYSEKHQWEIQNDFCKRQSYPDDGNGANITYVEITTCQVN